MRHRALGGDAPGPVHRITSVRPSQDGVLGGLVPLQNAP